MNKLNRDLVSNLNDNMSVEIGTGLCGTTRILQFGEGNFLRAFADWMFDKLNAETDFQGDTVIVQPIEHGRARELKAADCVYTVALRGKQGGRLIDNKRIITTVADAVSCYDNFESLCQLAVSENLRFVVSNTTEAGIIYSPEDYTPTIPQKSFPAKVAAFLKMRFDTIGHKPSSGVIFLPVELIEANGSTLKSCILRYADDWGFCGQFTNWLENQCIFCDTLVDRIVTGYPSDEIDELQEELVYEDKNFVTGEIYHLWLIQSPVDIQNELPLESAGLNVKWVNDLAPYRERKVRFLNGAHTCSVLAGYHCGFDLVREMIEDETMKSYIEHIMFDEIAPTVDLPGTEKTEFANQIIERFSNPFIAHLLLDISLNSVSKWAVRVMPTLFDYASEAGRLPRLLTFSLAALLRFYRGQFIDGKYIGIRENSNEQYVIRDDEKVLSYFAEQWSHNDIKTVVAETLANDKLWTRRLDGVPGLTVMITRDLDKIIRDGMKAAVINALQEASK